MSDPEIGTYIGIQGIQVATASPFKDGNQNLKIMTSGRILQEIDKAITNNGFNYIVDNVVEITYTSPASPTRPAATAVSPDNIFVHVVDENSDPDDRLPPYYEFLTKVKTSDEPATYEYVCNKVPLSSTILDSRSNHKDIYTLCTYPEAVPSTGEVVPYYYQEWIKTNSAYNYVVNQVKIVEYTSPAEPVITPSPTEASDEIIFVHVVDKASTPNPDYYELLMKIKVDDTPTYKYVCYQAPISSVVLDLTNEDIYTLYNYVTPVPESIDNETVPYNYQRWLKTDRFNEDKLINLTNTETSLTTKGNVQIDGDSKLLIKELDSYHTPADQTTYAEITKTDFILTKSTTTSTITETNAIAMTSDEREGEPPTSTTNAFISVSYTNSDSSKEPPVTYTDSVVISSHDVGNAPNTTGASVVVTGVNSYIETPILRLLVVGDD